MSLSKIILPMMVSTFTLLTIPALAGGISSGTRPLKYEVSCRNAELNLQLSVVRTRAKEHVVTASGPFGLVQELSVLRSEPAPQDTASTPALRYSAPNFELEIPLTEMPTLQTGAYEGSGKLQFQPGDAIFSAPLTCTVWPD